MKISRNNDEEKEEEEKLLSKLNINKLKNENEDK